MYRHTQVGWMILGTCGVIAAILLAQGPNPGSSMRPPLLVLAAVSVLFASLTVEVDDQEIRVAFGPGAIRKRIRLSDVSACRTVRNPALAGWGIRWIGSGWLYNVSGLDAVELSMKNGSLFRIGTDEPDALAAAIERRLR